VGHELRNPLAVIQTSTYFLKAVVESDNPKVAKHIGILEQEIANDGDIISNLLDFSRTRIPQPSQFSLSGLVNEVVGRCDLTNVRTGFRLEEIEVLADRSQVAQIVGNVVSNGAQAMPEGGDLRLSARRHNGHGCFVVEDTGEGIAPDRIDKIFQPLFTTKTKGIGLGLAVCDTLIRANGGTISVESELGQGSRFTISLPVGD
jgi:signal transduction histidine kinase